MNNGIDSPLAEESATTEEEIAYLLSEGSERLRAGRVEEASTHFEKVLELDARNEQAKNLLGLASFRLERYDEAEKLFVALIEENPVEPSLRLNLAMVHLKTGALEAAKSSLEQVLDLNPSHPRAASYMAKVFEKLGDRAEAIVWHERAGNESRAAELRAQLLADREAAAHAEPPVDQAAAAPQPDAAPAPEPESEPQAESGPPPQVQPAAPAPMSTPEPVPVAMPSDDPPAPPELDVDDGETRFSEIPPRTEGAPVDDVPAPPSAAFSSGAEAAALVAASAESMRRPNEIPPEDARERARGGSLGFTLEVDKSSDGGSPPGFAGMGSDAPVPPAPPTPAPVLRSATALHLSELREEDLGLRDFDGPVHLDEHLVRLPIDDVLCFRTDRLVALTGELEVEPVNRRYRGRRTDSLFGGREAALCAAMGQGVAVVDADEDEITSLRLESEDLYLLESVILAFTSGLVWENGRLPEEGGDDLDIVHLRGTGTAVLATSASVRAIEVRNDAPVTVAAHRLIGWNGQVVPFRGPFPGLPDGVPRPSVVRFEGTGLVLST